MNQLIKVLRAVFFSLAVLLTACKQSPEAQSEEVVQAQPASLEDSLPLIDTIITFKGTRNSAYNGSPLTAALAKKILETTFIKKGYVTTDVFYEYAEQDSIINAVISFEKLDIIDLNHNQYPDGIITYGANPPMASSHCFNAQYAIIYDTDSGYTLMEQDFLPYSFRLDSIVTGESNIILYVQNYDCMAHETTKRYKIKLKTD